MKDEPRDLEQELAAGQNEATPFWALSSVILTIAALVAVALGLVALAYFLA